MQPHLVGEGQPPSGLDFSLVTLASEGGETEGGELVVRHRWSTGEKGPGSSGGGDGRDERGLETFLEQNQQGLVPDLMWE